MTTSEELLVPDGSYAAAEAGLKITDIQDGAADPYEEKVVYTYADDPEMWRKALGDTLMFQWGVYNHPDSPRPVSLEEAGIRYFERQLELAGVRSSKASQPQRILDLGCGWGFIMKYLADLFPDCPRIDGINVSGQQLKHCAEYLKKGGVADRVNLYRCNARDVAQLPDPQDLYDLVVIRGVISHFSPELYEECVAGLASRVCEGGTVIISENLYNTDLDSYTSAIPDEEDRLACGYRKTPRQVTQVLEDSGFRVTDLRVLPSNTDVARWLLEVRSNIETFFPEGVTGPLEELRVLAENLSIALLLDKFSAYSIIARREA